MDPVFPLDPFTLTESDSTWVTELLAGTSLQINATADELVFDLTTPPSTNAAVVLMSKDADFRQFRFVQTNQPGFQGNQVIIQDAGGAGSDFFLFSLDENLRFPVAARELSTLIDLAPDVFEVKVVRQKRYSKSPKGQFLTAFIEPPAGVTALDIDVMTVSLSVNGTALAMAMVEDAVIADNVLEVRFPLNLTNVSTLLGVEVVKIKKVHGRRNPIKVEAITPPAHPTDLLEVTVSGGLMGGGSFKGTDVLRVIAK